MTQLLGGLARESLEFLMLLTFACLHNLKARSKMNRKTTWSVQGHLAESYSYKLAEKTEKESVANSKTRMQAFIKAVSPMSSLAEMRAPFSTKNCTTCM